jgi:hypothetical protein
MGEADSAMVMRLMFNTQESGMSRVAGTKNEAEAIQRIQSMDEKAMKEERRWRWWFDVSSKREEIIWESAQPGREHQGELESDWLE